MNTITRRNWLKTAALGTPLVAAAPLAAGASRNPNPGRGWFYRHSIGKFEVFVLSDGEIGFPAHPTFGGEIATKEEVEAVLVNHYRDPSRLVAQLNLCLLDDGNTRTLIDVGYGERGHDGTGTLLESLAQAGYRPDDIDQVLITHAHPDHFYGITTKAGDPVFPKARILMNKVEEKFWNKSKDEVDAMKESGNRFAGMFETLSGIFSEVSAQLELIEAGISLGGGLRCLDLAGHTPGHQGFLVESEGERLAVLGDTANHEILMTVEPDWPFGFDNDPQMTALTRRDIFGKVADQRIEVLGYHWSLPGLAYIGRAGNAFRWYPSPIQR